ncbi:MAG: 4Fe-4S dicluster domain-containing protein [Candidatus Latescibacteria bacterium]|nr:4Fe-4S dicluster domain-containing protein [Candidatus Latescibacterota bacterium]NIO27216.1 4Fe-4S dicluster domain-containing protein [Candidatus Latescibacterota bacterium]NIO54740.1 4Fe-4S dicluster domain-containing protein [Candidatus Latescibacterota bacterium]NIT00823.1 4Fe-4S dicluster domain-containing protein [Candidatus Latescibacterota bacterium]NIT37746.1 4Fe-4S dicluster domain-containing protein [Candidatus Latescibacterota bacterium]
MMEGDRVAFKLSTPGVLPKSERKLREEFLSQLELVPGGEKIKSCIQCGTCTGSCPVSYVMDISPREVIARFRIGDIESILKSRTIWVCASCYACTTRCPSGIRITDILYAMKRTAIEEGIFPSRFPVYTMSEGFVKNVNRYGRNHEMGLLVSFYLRTSPLKLLKMLPLGWRLFKRKRISFTPMKIKRLDQIKSIVAKAESQVMPSEKASIMVASTVGYGSTTEVKQRAAGAAQGGAK